MTRRKLIYAACGLLALLLVLAVSAVLVVRSEWFREMVRARIVREVEQASGGRAEIGSFRFDWSALRAEVERFVLRGTEPPQEAPLFRADSMRVDLRVVSMLRRDIDLAAVVIEKPEVRIRVAADGSTNIPGPRGPRSDRSWAEQILRLEIRRLELREGFVEYDSRRVPLNLRAEKLRARLDYEPGRYLGTVSVSPLRIHSEPLLPFAFNADVALALERDRLLIPSARLASGDSRIEANGVMRDWKSPVSELDVRASASLAELGGPLRLPISHTGRLAFEGKIRLGAGGFEVDGKASGRGLAVRQAALAVEGIAFDSGVRLARDKLELRPLSATALGGAFQGSAEVEDFRRYRAEGSFRDLSLQNLTRVDGIRRVGWSATVSGDVKIAGGLRGAETGDQRLDAHLAIEPGGGENPLSGAVTLAWDQRRRSLELGTSHLATPDSRINFTGALGENLQVGVQTRNLNDVLPALALFSESPPAALPVALRNGVARFEGTVRGPLDRARVAGAASIERVEYAGRLVDRASARIDLSPSEARFSEFTLEQGSLRVAGSGGTSLDAWRVTDASTLRGAFTIEGALLDKLLAAEKIDIPAAGVLSGRIDVAGTWAAPRAGARIRIEQPVLHGQPFEHVEAALRYSSGLLELEAVEARLGKAPILAKGAWEHAPGDWRNGRVRFEIDAKGIEVAGVRRVEELRSGLSGSLDASARGGAQIRDAALELSDLSAEVSLRNVVQRRKPMGAVALKIETRQGVLAASASASLRGATIRGGGEWKIGAGYPGKGEVRVSRLSFAALQEMAQPETEADTLPFAGFVDAEASFRGPLLDAKAMQASVKITTFELGPKPAPEVPSAAASGLILRNDGVLTADIDPQGVHIRQARFTAKDTTLAVNGTFSFQDRTPWDIDVKGTVNLAVLGSFNPDLVSRGVSNLDAVVRGTLEQPQVTGRMELKDASFYLTDVPNGLDRVNGVVLFDRTRATLEKLTAQSGGGDLSLTGFVGFEGGELTYRLQAQAVAVRVRYPEGVSTSANALLSFTGTARRSLLAGTLTILRSGFTPRTDVGGLLARSAATTTAPVVTNEFLRNMQFDIRVETAQDAQFSTSLTRDVQAEIDLRVRGSPARPVVLGRISVTEGEINFFGSRYVINRGEINFFNPVKVEPVIDMDLETRVRGVVVTINFAGPVSKLAMSYRSDPPLRSDEILALLAVGRAPQSTTLGGGQSVQNPGILATGANTLLGQALAAPVSSQLQRFFGVSRLRIDPQLTGTENTPQARLTIEQQVSRDITLTFVSSINRAQQQLVRLEWNLSREWSLIAVRDENGIFGLDFLYRKRFK